jgi:hypothetical protein
MGDQPPLNGPVCLTALVELPIPASWSKPRTAVSFVKNFGDRRWELDALDPTNLRACVEEQILECIIEPTAWERCKVVERAERESLRTVLAEWGQR